MAFATLLCWISWWFVIANIDPYASTASGFVFFYTSLFFALLGTMTIISFLIHKFLAKDLQPLFRHVHKSFQEGLIISSLLIVLLYLQSAGVLHVWNLIIFVLAGLFAGERSLDLQTGRNDEGLRQEQQAAL